jgi:hypothetical protein
MSTPDSLERLLLKHDDQLQTLLRRRSIVPSRNPEFDSGLILGDLDVQGALAAASLTIGGVRAATNGDLVRYGFLTQINGGYTVLMDGDLSSTAVTIDRAAARDYPMIGDRVLLTHKGDGTWHIIGRVWSTQYLAPLNGWGIYDNTYLWPQAYKTYEGIVSLQGLVAKGTTTLGTVIAVLPPGYRPDYDLLLPVNDTDNHGRLVIRANGNIEVYGLAAGGYASLSGITFPAAGVATWKVFGVDAGYAFANSWTNYTQAGYNFGPFRIWQSLKSGVVFVQGVLAGGSTTALNTMVTFPAGGLTPVTSQLMQSVGPGSVYGGWRAQPANLLAYEAGGNGALPVYGTYLTAAVNSGDTAAARVSPIYSGNGWVDYDASTYGTVFGIRYQGINYMSGLIKSGTAGAVSNRYQLRNFYAVEGPDTTSTNAVVAKVQSASGVGRMDVSSQGTLTPRNGNTTWFSFGGFSYITR